jgi:hypothetical protein
LDEFENTIYNHSINSIHFNEDLGFDLPQAVTKRNYHTSNNNDLLSISFKQISKNKTAVVTEQISNNSFLIWGNNGANINASSTSMSINLSSGITPALVTNTNFTPLKRVWKIIASDGNLQKINLQLKENVLPQIEPLRNYYLIVSNTPQFDDISDYQIMKSDAQGNLETDFDFEGTNYFTFGFTAETVAERSIHFDGTDDYIDMDNKLNLNPSNFTVSAWIKRDATNSGIVSIVSKRDTEFTAGYDLRILSDNRVEIIWKNGSDQFLISNTSLPNNEWHHVAATYNGSEVSIYIDGVLDTIANKTPPIDSNESFHIGAAGNNVKTQYFSGNIDEVCLWNVALSEAQLRFILNQELANNSGQVTGVTLPHSTTKNDINNIPWSALAGYYPMSTYTLNSTNDASGNGIHGTLININTVDRQTAPLPYISAEDGDWTSKDTWNNGSVQYIPGSISIVDPNITIDWNIVKTSHFLDMNNSSLPIAKGNNRKVLGLFIDDSELTIIGDTNSGEGNGLTVSHYMNLTGKINLEGESQLIQNPDSDLDVAMSGTLERHQQASADTYTYKYWSSPVGKIDIAKNDYKYTVQDIMFDETGPINFITAGYNGAATTPIGIADYWIWKYANQTNNDYSSWQHVRRTGTINAGEGFTMKGPGTGSITTNQNYVFLGKPNNGDINLTIHSGNDYLVGNPYPSAIDANQFIIDNGPANAQDSSPTISGTLYFWQHWGGGSHYLADYQGGYATYNFSGSVAAASYGTNNQFIATGGKPTQLPRRYIPIGQGFFVVGKNTGSINFNNGQRVFQKESTSVSPFSGDHNTIETQAFYNSAESDNRMKFRIGFKSINTIHRQLLLTIDENASPNVDWAYDAKKNESQMDDMYWLINEDAYIIQASDEAEPTSIFPIGIQTNTDGINTITIDALENVSNDINIYLHDIVLDLYHDLRQSDYEVFLNANQYHNRFEITFSTNSDALGIDDETINGIDILYSNDIQKLILINPNLLDIKSIELFNIIGQSIYVNNAISESGYSEYDVKNLSTGTYIIKLSTGSGSVITKKVLVN